MGDVRNYFRAKNNGQLRKSA